MYDLYGPCVGACLLCLAARAGMTICFDFPGIQFAFTLWVEEKPLYRRLVSVWDRGSEGFLSSGLGREAVLPEVG